MISLTDDERVADLQRRLDQTLAQQAATAEVLKAISRSTFITLPRDHGLNRGAKPE
jgi:hypothetical protein